MPVVYPWTRLYGWYDFASPDYRWFYNMLKVMSNAGANTPNETPIIPFVHYHRIFYPDPVDESVIQMSETAYKELLINRKALFFPFINVRA